ncbi:WD repeat-containing protein DWA2-like [Cucurbita moschata]|uniref:WD repeat-containing protein DWA2-like n=1 Tax=Cucurbita moschata TaxID=3662 RepID=A0A6J1GIH1_CUCMO|nr:WD repeat-containing protein DWA2-like [Cucurbita moschata]
MLHYLSGGTWDPSESSVQFWDLRTMKKTDSIACSAYIRNVDYNPKRKHLLVTAEDETGISLWDLRNPKVPIQQLPGHTHWTCAARCNPEYDGLILSAGTDSAVNLWLPSVSNGELKSESSCSCLGCFFFFLFKIYADTCYLYKLMSRSVDSPPQQGDPLLHSYSDYEDSVYGLAWSCREPWIFASLSYDGRVVVESVKPFLSR